MNKEHTTTVHLSGKARKILDALHDSDLSFNFSDWVSRRLVEEFEDDMSEAYLQMKLDEIEDELSSLTSKRDAVLRKIETLQE